MNEVIEWNTLEHMHSTKSTDWYWSLGIIALALAILAVVLNDILFAILILIAAFAAGLLATRSPRILHVELNSKGIIYHNRLHLFRNLDSFWIEEHEHFQPAIILKSKSFFMPFIIIPIDEVHHDDIRHYLLDHLPEVEHHESIAHRVLEFFGF